MSKIALAIILFTIVNGFQGFGQTKDPFIYTFPRGQLQLPHAFNFNTLCPELVNQSKSLGSTELAENTAKYRQLMYEKGLVYKEWKELEDYLNEILQKILPDSLKNKTGIHVYPVRSTDINASIFFDGAILFDLGMFTALNDEAGISLILGHELAHYIHKDQFERYRNKKKGDQSFNFVTIDHLGISRSGELRADITGAELIIQAGYNLNTALENFKLFQKTYLGTLSPEDERRSTHPLLSKRESEIVKIALANKKTGENFLVSENKFRELKHIASQELINISLERHQYHLAQTLGLSLFLNSNSKEVPSWFIAESARRHLLLYPETGKLKAYEYLRTDSLFSLKGYRSLFKDSITFNCAVEEFSKLGLRPSSDVKELILILLKKAAVGNVAESYLSLALYQPDNRAQKDSCLKLYIESPTARFKRLAGFLIDAQDKPDSLNKLACFDNITYMGNQYSLFTKNKKDHYKKYFNSFKDVVTRYYPEYGISGSKEIPDYLRYKQIITSLELLESHSNSTTVNLLFLNPLLFEYLSATNTSEIKLIKLKVINEGNITVRTAVFCCFLPVCFPVFAIARTFTGSRSNSYTIYSSTIKFTTTQANFNRKSKTVKYLLRPSYFENTLYHLLHEKK